MERYRMFEITRGALALRIESLQADMQRTTQELKALDSLRDGDMMDDPLMHALLERREMLERESSQLVSYLGGESGVITDEELKEKTSITVGHEVRLKTKYADGFEEEFNVTIGTPIDVKYLSGQINSPFNREGNLLISDETPLAQALIGKEVNQSVSYQVGDETSRAKILDIRTSPLVVTKKEK